MSHSDRVRVMRVVVAMAVIALLGPAVHAQNHAPNTYSTVEGWTQMPEGREWGSTSAVYPAQDGSGNIWVGERCGQNSCVGRDDVDSVLLFDPSGKLLKSFGAGMIVWPHGIFVDPDNNVWIADARGEGDQGHQVIKFSPDGEVLMRLGKAGVASDGPDTFNQPSDVLVAPSGDIFVADGHGRTGNNRIVKFSSDGTFIKAWGQTGSAPGEFQDPHVLAMDSEGRLFVGDRNNRRVQIFDQDGNFIAHWYQFGRPSGVFIDANDVIYVADSESNSRSNPGYKRGIRIAGAKDGFVTAFIPDPVPDADRASTSGAEGVAVDAAGNIYGAEVGPQDIKKYVKQ